MKLLRITTVATSLGLLKGQLRFLSDNGLEVVAVADNSASRREGATTDELKEVERTEGVRTVDVAMHREISLLADLRSLWSLYRLFRREKPDIVHANTPKGSLLAMLAARLAGVKHRIYTVTGLRFETATGPFRHLLIAMEQLTCACATKVIPEGLGVKKTLIREHITSKDLQVVHNGNLNGVDLNYSSPDAVEAAEDAPKGTFNFIFVGRMVRDKGIHELVEAFVRVNDRYPQTRLILLGRFEPELDPISPEVAETIKKHQAIITPGYQNDVRPWLKSSDALVHPSYREGFPNVILEAGAMALPCIVTDINGSNEIIVPQKNGLIVPVRDTDALERAMNKLIENPSLADEMRKNARPMIAERFDRRDVHRAMLQMYRSL